MDLPTTAASVLGGVILLGGAVKAWPSVWNFVKAAAKGPAMIEAMYAEFSPNSSTSLRDAVNRLETGQGDAAETDAKILTWQEEHALDDLTRLTELATQNAVLTAQHEETNEYLHRRMHDVLNRIAPLVGWAKISDTRLSHIETELNARTAIFRDAGLLPADHPDLPVVSEPPPSFPEESP